MNYNHHDQNNNILCGFKISGVIYSVSSVLWAVPIRVVKCLRSSVRLQTNLFELLELVLNSNNR